MSTTSRLSIVLLGLVAVSCGAPAVPSNPSWDQDVFPILQGSCNHCHGETVGKLPAQPVGRLDFCDPAPFMAEGIMAQMWLGAKAEAITFPAFIKSTSGRPPMPPPPAAELSDYERDILLKWGANTSADKCNKTGRNREPVFKVIGDPQWGNDELRLTLEVSDPDKDQVLGKVVVGNAEAIIPAAGRREVIVTGAQRGQIRVLLLDGYSRVEETL